jgi:hypothetical protein
MRSCKPRAAMMLAIARAGKSLGTRAAKSGNLLRPLRSS